MTFEEIKNCSKPMLTCADLKEIWKCDPYVLHETAVYYPEQLPVAPLIIGTERKQVKFPRLAVIRYMETGMRDN